MVFYALECPDDAVAVFDPAVARRGAHILPGKWRKELVKAVFLHDGVRVNGKEEAMPCPLQSCIQCRRLARMACGDDFCAVLFCDSGSLVCGAVIDNKDFHLMFGIVKAPDCIKAVANDAFLIVCWNDD